MSTLWTSCTIRCIVKKKPTSQTYYSIYSKREKKPMEKAGKHVLV